MPTLAELIDPAPGRVAVAIADREEMRGGLYISLDAARSIHEAKPIQGNVVAIGAEDDEEPETWFSIGDLVVFSKYSGTEVRRRKLVDPTKASGPSVEERIVIMNFKDIIARIKDPEAADEIKVKG